MSDVSGTSPGAAEREAEMREHERRAQKHAATGRSPEVGGDEDAQRMIDPDSGAADPAGPDSARGAGRDDARSGKPAPPGNTHIGGGLTGGS